MTLTENNRTDGKEEQGREGEVRVCERGKNGVKEGWEK